MLDQLVHLVDMRTLILVVMVFLLASWYLQIRMPGLPHGPFPLPVLGNLLSLGNGMMDKTLLKWRRKFGDVFMFYMGGRRTIVICGYDNMKELYNNTGDDFMHRPSLYLFDKASKGAKGVLFSNDLRWKQSRRFTLMSMRDFGASRQSLQTKVIAEAMALCGLLGDNAGRITDVKPLLSSCVSNVICSVAFGRRFEFDDPEFVEVAKAMHEAVTKPGLAAIANFLPWMRFLPMVYTLDEFETMERFIRRKIAEHRTTFKSDQPPRDFVDLYLQVEDGTMSDYDQSLFDEDHMYVIIRDLFLAGTETTATTLLWAVLFLSLHEDAQQRCREEILTVLGPDGTPDMDQRQSMPFVDATILETQRLGDITALGAIRCAVKDTTLLGFHVPKGTIVLPFFHTAHRDEKVWPDPESFLPERWLDAEKREMLEEHLIAFSVGRRNCLGESLAKVEMFLFLTMMLQKYSFSIPEGKPRPSIEGVMGLTRTPKSFEVLVTKVVVE